MVIVDVLAVLFKLAETVVGAILYIVSSGQWGGAWTKRSYVVRGLAGFFALVLTYMAFEPLFPIPKIEPTIAALFAPDVGKSSKPSISSNHLPRGIGPPSFDARAIELEYWQAIARSDDPSLYRDYLRRYPTGTFAAVAGARLKKLEVAGGNDMPGSRPISPVKPPPASPMPYKPPVEHAGDSRCVTVIGGERVCE